MPRDQLAQEFFLIQSQEASPTQVEVTPVVQGETSRTQLPGNSWNIK